MFSQVDLSKGAAPEQAQQLVIAEDVPHVQPYRGSLQDGRKRAYPGIALQGHTKLAIEASTPMITYVEFCGINANTCTFLWIHSWKHAFHRLPEIRIHTAGAFSSPRFLLAVTSYSQLGSTQFLASGEWPVKVTSCTLPVAGEAAIVFDLLPCRLKGRDSSSTRILLRTLAYVL